eukprot:scaffold105806_cov60-Phaeocystis_antarctica.AAC.3
MRQRVPAVSPSGRHYVRSTYLSSPANRWSNSSGAEVLTKPVTSWSDTPNGQQCGLHDNYDNGVRNEPSVQYRMRSRRLTR